MVSCCTSCNNILGTVVSVKWKFRLTSGFWPAVVKKRLVKLVVNFLFYFRTDEEEVSDISMKSMTSDCMTSWSYCFSDLVSRLEPCCWNNVGLRKRTGQPSLLVSLTLFVCLSRTFICHHDGEIFIHRPFGSRLSKLSHPLGHLSGLFTEIMLWHSKIEREKRKKNMCKCFYEIIFYKNVCFFA